MGTVGSIVALQNGHGDVHVGIDALRFRYKHVTQMPPLTLNQLLGNQNGHFRWGMDDPTFHGRVRNFTLNESRLLAELRTDDNKWVWDGIDLDRRFRIGPKGELFALDSTKDDAKVIAVGRALPRPDLPGWSKVTLTAGQKVLE
ncbi:hypothetical protein BKA70DRAFT_1401003 [Coprinopsis sp. MPI-PUGE-AT-0042]|nr:hypothetical protein BKA70DRAFT_1401003 [Coprinopsis sp. MPI-PUGE-AT-0042]